MKDLVLLGVVGIVFTVLFMYNHTQLASLRIVIEEQSKKIDALQHTKGADETLILSLQSKVSFFESKLGDNRQSPLSDEVRHQIDQTITDRARSLILNEKGQVNWLQLAHAADFNPSTEVVRELVHSIENVERVAINLETDLRYLLDNALILAGTNACIISAPDACPQHMIGTSHVMVGALQPEGKVPLGYQNVGTFNDQGWQWLQGVLCCVKPLQ
ncbi:hypothetical protein EON65_40310 [archaeon]|nr:MAG: hypothetical protein EON65_40310 [archaeon]